MGKYYRICITNGDIKDLFYIGDKLQGGRNYRWDFSFKTKEEAEKLVKNTKAKIIHKDKISDFFVYNERTEELVPFKKDDCMLYDSGYLKFDGKEYLSYDDIGNEVWKFPFSKN